MFLKLGHCLALSFIIPFVTVQRKRDTWKYLNSEKDTGPGYQSNTTGDTSIIVPQLQDRGQLLVAEIGQR